MVQRVKMICAYDGSCYRGWQRQSNAPSIQAVIEDALARMHHHPVSISASGRTDAYVHALGQVFHFDSDMDLDEAHWQSALNSLLPKEIQIQRVELVEESFHSRFCAVWKRYDYLVTQRIHDPFIQRYMGLERQVLDVAYMQECAAVFVGTHDFTSFTSAKIDARKSRIKTIRQISVTQEGDHICISFIGNGFLRYMVRMLAQTLIEAGKHNLSKDDLFEMLRQRDKQVCRYKAAAQGLYLVGVEYGGKEDESELSYAYDALSACAGR